LKTKKIRETPTHEPGPKGKGTNSNFRECNKAYDKGRKTCGGGQKQLQTYKWAKRKRKSQGTHVSNRDNLGGKTKRMWERFTRGGKGGEQISLSKSETRRWFEGAHNMGVGQHHGTGGTNTRKATGKKFPKATENTEAGRRNL